MQIVIAVSTQEVARVDPFVHGLVRDTRPHKQLCRIPLFMAIELPLYQTHPLHCLGLNLILTTVLKVAVRFILSFYVVICDVCSYGCLALS